MKTAFTPGNVTQNLELLIGLTHPWAIVRLQQLAFLKNHYRPNKLVGTENILLVCFHPLSRE